MRFAFDDIVKVTGGKVRGAGQPGGGGHDIWVHSVEIGRAHV